jgi:hypothetical protein
LVIVAGVPALVKGGFLAWVGAASYLVTAALLLRGSRWGRVLLVLLALAHAGLVISMLAGERFCAPCLAAACLVWAAFLVAFASRAVLAVLIAVLVLILPWFYQEEKAPPARQVAPFLEKPAQVEEPSPPANQREPCG